MTHQPPLFCDSVYDALGAMVVCLGGPKRVGARLWPDKSARDAGKLLKDCLNPNRKEKLDPAQVVLLFRWSREAGFHVAKHWLDAETGYVPSAPLTAQDEQSQLVAVIETAGATLQNALNALDRIHGRKPAVRAAMPDAVAITQTKVA